MSFQIPDALTIIAGHKLALFDAYGVLLGAEGALPFARELISHLQAENRDFFVVTNDASKTPARIASFYDRLGFSIPTDQILSSGALLTSFVAENGSRGAQCLVLGPPDSVTMAENAGLEVMAWESCKQAPEVLVVADEAGFPFLPAMEHVLTLLFQRIDAGKSVQLLLPNPDLLYPKNLASFGFAAGSVALLFEQALRHRYGEHAPAFLRLGKPNRLLFDQACEMAGTRDAVMFGDQLETDIRGANGAGIASVLVETGVGRWKETLPPALRPTHRLTNLAFR